MTIKGNDSTVLKIKNKSEHHSDNSPAHRAENTKSPLIPALEIGDKQNYYVDLAFSIITGIIFITLSIVLSNTNNSELMDRSVDTTAANLLMMGGVLGIVLSPVFACFDSNGHWSSNRIVLPWLDEMDWH